MAIFKNIQVESEQEWQGERLIFDPDASPKAWEHYMQYYNKIFGNSYSICSPTLFSYVCSNVYIPKPKENSYNRLYALEKNAKPLYDEENNVYYEAALRLSGETDFNFNEYHYTLLEPLLANNPEYIGKLEKCKKQHHSLINFSLMQSVGNMQGFKGKKCNDRFDRFTYFLGEFYDAKDKMDTDIIRYSNPSNKEDLIRFLTGFRNLREYFENAYFINDEGLINNLRKRGEKELDTYESAKEYVDLAYRFWNEKEFFFSKNEYLAIDSYFSEGGEAYTHEELTWKLTNDLGITDQKEIDIIIQKCLARGFIYQCDNNVYTR